MGIVFPVEQGGDVAMDIEAGGGASRQHESGDLCSNERAWCRRGRGPVRPGDRKITLGRDFL